MVPHLVKNEANRTIARWWPARATSTMRLATMVVCSFGGGNLVVVVVLAVCMRKADRA